MSRWNYRFAWFSLGAALAASLALHAHADESAGKAVSVSGKVLIRNGKSTAAVRLMKAGDDLRAGDLLNTGSDGTVKLLMSDHTILDLAPSTSFSLDEYELRHGSDRKVTLGVDFGKIRGAVNQKVGLGGKFTLKTRAAVMGVRGTEFVVNSELSQAPATAGKPAAGSAGGHERQGAASEIGKTEITVIHGRVEVTSTQEGAHAKPVSVSGGEQLTATTAGAGDGNTAGRAPASGAASAPGAAMQVVQLSKQDLGTVQTQAKVEDRTFVNAVVIENSGKNGSTGLETLAAVAQGFQPPKDYIPHIENLPLPGNLGSDYGVRGNDQKNLGSLPVRLKVVFKK